MKNNFFIKMIFIILLLFCLSFDNNAFAIPNEIKAFVGREIITEQDVIDKIDMMVFLNRIDKNLLIHDKKIFNDIVHTLINEKLLAKQIKKNRINVSEKEISEMKDVILKRYNISEEVFQDASFNKNVFRNFIIHDIAFNHYIVKKIRPKLKFSQYGKDLFTERLYKKLQKNSGVYKIFQFSRRGDNFLINSINSRVISQCSQIEELEKQFHLNRIFLGEFKINELNPRLQDIISSKDGDKGVFAYKDESEVNIIGFCQIKVDNVQSIDQEKIDSLYKDNQLMREVNGHYRKLVNSNFVLVKN